jgi:uncharacterized damage-inducible protein DinB
VVTLKENLLSLSDYSFERTTNRLAGLTDDEYFWEPVPNCWTLRRQPDGEYRGDWAVSLTGSGPFTTLAWRLSHLIHCYGAKRNAMWLNLEPAGSIGDAPFTSDAVGDDVALAPTTAAAALAALDAAHDVWRACLTAASEATLAEKIGPIGGQYAESDRADFVLHMLDEFIHHGAELGVLRDLYRSQREAEVQDPLVRALLAGDADTVADAAEHDPAAIDRVRAASPKLVLTAAESGRWHAIPLLLQSGFAADVSEGIGPLHCAAGAGRLDVVRMLVDQGADADRADPTWNATPRGWAEFFRHLDVVEFLEKEGTN